MFSWVKFTAGRWVWSGSGELLGGLVKAIHHSVHGRHGLYHVVEGLVPEKIKLKQSMETKRLAIEKCFEPDCEHLKMNPIHF